MRCFITINDDRKENVMLQASDLAKRFNLKPHKEGGDFLDLKPSRVPGVRDASGAIYYYLPQGKHSEYHVIDCDEYWAFAAGGTLELWIISPEGKLTIELLGVDDDANPLVFITAGSIFAARHKNIAMQETFLSCITVPRFEHDGFRLVSKEEIAQLCPEALEFCHV